MDFQSIALPTELRHLLFDVGKYKRILIIDKIIFKKFPFCIFAHSTRLMNIAIDIGNTRAKLAVFDDNKILKTTVCYKEHLIEQQKQLCYEFPAITDGILANVATPDKGNDGIFSELSGKKIILSATTPLPFINVYGTPETLGLDRIALAAAAVANFPYKNTLVIDAGTAITYDIIDKDKRYIGGAISPGLNMRYRALNNFTADLPFLRAEKIIPPNVGRNTLESLRLGVNQGVVYEIDGFISRYKEAYEDLTIILTGGDYEILSKRLKNTIFAAKNFLLTGLNSILEHNKA